MDRLLGTFAACVLAAVCEQEGQGNLTSIRDRTKYYSERTAGIGATHTVLRRLLKDGLVSTTLRPSTPKRGGKAVTLYAITEKGEEQLSEFVEFAHHFVFTAEDLVDDYR